MVSDCSPKHSGVSPIGRHFVVDYWECDTEILKDETKLAMLLNRAAEAAGARVMSSNSHQFDGQGVAAISILAESHISIHTWPEVNYAAVDIYTCGSCVPLLAHKVLVDALSSRSAKFVELERGRADSSQAIEMCSSKAPPRSGLDDNHTWFFEGSVPGKRHGNMNHGFAISQFIASERTPFQEVVIFDSPVYGRVLALDGIVQLSTSDEHIYHEMLIHPPMFVHPNPQRVLIVGGGDGAALREVLQHDPKQVVMIDIDEQFVRCAAEHLPSLSAGAFEDSRLELLFEDASTALRRFENAFDVAIIDCNSAIGTSGALFEDGFYATVARALKNNAVCSAQAGSMLDMDFLKQTRQRMTTHIGDTTCFRLTIPSYHCGEYVFMLATRSEIPAKPDSSILTKLQCQRGINTRYWSPEIHQTSQIFPNGSPLA